MTKRTIGNYLKFINSPLIKQAGFTLVELMVGLLLSSLIGVLLISLWVQNNGIFIHQTANVGQGISLNQSGSYISDAIKSASSVASSYPLVSPTYFSNSSSLVLAVPSVDSSGDSILNVYDYEIFVKDSANPLILRKIVFSDPSSSRKAQNMVLTTNLSDLSFSYLDKSGNIVSPTAAQKVKFIITQNEKIAYGQVQNNVTGEANLRND